MTILVWCGIVFCISQSAMFSGLNLAFFSISKLRLEIEKKQGNGVAENILLLRDDSNFLLTTILWGNVGINVLLTLLSNQVFAGLGAFLFSTLFITVVGEIVPQAYFSRHALKMAGILTPVLKIYQVLLYPFAKPAALLLDQWLGKEGIHFYKERDFRKMLELHMHHKDSDIDTVEGKGALNFMALDDLTIDEEGELIDPDSIVEVSFANKTPIFPEFKSNPEDPFLSRIQKSGKKWVIFTDEQNSCYCALDADSFLREVFFTNIPLAPNHFCHLPIVLTDPKTSLGHALLRLKVDPQRTEDDVIDEDIILLWGETKRVITGADILGRLMRGIVPQQT